MSKVLEWYNQQFEKRWYNKLLPFLSSDAMETIRKTIVDRRKKAVIVPKSIEMFEAFQLCKWDDVRVVILGIEPYGETGESTGVAFKAKTMYPSHDVITEIFEEIYYDVDEKDNNLRLGEIRDVNLWLSQGVLLMNTALTLQKGKPMSHIELWKPFTVNVLNILQEKTGVIYLLWGDHAKEYKKYINENNNYILEAGYPTPKIKNNGFRGCNHFSKINELIIAQNGAEFKIKW